MIATTALDGLPTETAGLDAIDRDLAASGPAATLDALVDRLDREGKHRALLDALLLRARFDLGLPLVQVGSLADVAEPARSAYEDRYVEAIRRVGRKLLDGGDLVAAWPYFRAVAEKEPIASAIEAYRPSGEPGDDRLGQVIDIAFQQGVHPRRGFELILDHYGVCSAITAFEHLPPDEATRVASADRLVRHLHGQLVANLRADIDRQGHPVPPEGASVRDLLDGRDWLLADDAYHLDISHLGAVVRSAPMLTDPTTLALAVELTDYGRDLSERHRYESDPPFEALHEDHAVYLRALVGDDPDGAVAHFRSKLPAPSPPDPDGDGDGPRFDDTLPAQVLVRLLVRLGRLDEAIEVASEHLAGYPDSILIVPGLPQLCQMAGRPDLLAKFAREQGDAVHYAAALIQTAGG